MSVTFPINSSAADLDGFRSLMDAVYTVCTAEGIDFFIVGALARDLIFEHQHDIAPVRSTRDVDVAVIVADWDEYRDPSARLIREHGFREMDRSHRLEAPSGTLLDLIPFGAIETSDRAIGWPPDEAFVMSTLGFREVYEFSLTGIIDSEYGVQIASLPGISILKLLAWRDRRYETEKDAQDFCAVVVNYAEVICEALLILPCYFADAATPVSREGTIFSWPSYKRTNISIAWSRHGKSWSRLPFDWSCRATCLARLMWPRRNWSRG